MKSLNAFLIVSQSILLIIRQNNINIHGESQDFLCYSKSYNGVFCLACVLFPDSSHGVAKHLMPEPYQDWKDLLEDIENHAFTEYHINSTARLNELMRTMKHPENCIGVTIS